MNQEPALPWCPAQLALLSTNRDTPSWCRDESERDRNHMGPLRPRPFAANAACNWSPMNQLSPAAQTVIGRLGFLRGSFGLFFS
jgi:hypothetical protein